MNCREAISHLARNPETPLAAGLRSELEGHLAHCQSCRHTAAAIQAGLAAWRTAAARVEVPDANREWLEVRRRRRGELAPVEELRATARRFRPAWLALPLAAAAIAAVIFFPRAAVEDRSSRPGAAVARANSVDVPGGRSSTMVFVDDKSGWLIVWASDAGG